jgi:nickel-dependent lactate racemase
MAIIQLPGQDGSLSFDLPDAYLGEIVTPRPVTPASDPKALIRGALAQPIGTPPLHRILKPGLKVSLIIDDVSRETPTGMLLSPVLAELGRAGIHNEDISIVIALGTHRPMTQSEIVQKVGSGIAKAFQIINTPCWDDSEMVYMGESSNGIPAWVNRYVAQADVRIGLGMIAPHMDTGFSGGAKIILPGTCGCQTVEAFHASQAILSGNQLGIVEAPMRLDLETFVRDRVALDFVLNAVLAPDGSLYRCIAGDFVQAHRAGAVFAEDVYGIPVAQRYPVVISNAFPAQIDLWQSTKALASGELMTADQGTLVLVTPCPEGTKTHPHFVDYLGKDAEQLLAELLSGRVEDPVAAAVAVPLCRLKKRIRMAVVSSGLNPSDGARMGFTYYENIEAALRGELEGSGNRTSVGILTHGGVSLPLVAGMHNRHRTME